VLKGDGGLDYLLGIAPTGLVIYRNKTKIVSHFWSVATSLMPKTHAPEIGAENWYQFSGTSFSYQMKLEAKFLD